MSVVGVTAIFRVLYKLPSHLVVKWWGDYAVSQATQIQKSLYLLLQSSMIWRSLDIPNQWFMAAWGQCYMSAVHWELHMWLKSWVTCSSLIEYLSMLNLDNVVSKHKKLFSCSNWARFHVHALPHHHHTLFPCTNGFQFIISFCSSYFILTTSSCNFPCVPFICLKRFFCVSPTFILEKLLFWSLN